MASFVTALGEGRNLAAKSSILNVHEPKVAIEARKPLHSSLYKQEDVDGEPAWPA